LTAHWPDYLLSTPLPFDALSIWCWKTRTAGLQYGEGRGTIHQHGRHTAATDSDVTTANAALHTGTGQQKHTLTKIPSVHQLFVSCHFYLEENSTNSWLGLTVYQKFPAN